MMSYWYRLTSNLWLFYDDGNLAGTKYQIESVIPYYSSTNFTGIVASESKGNCIYNILDTHSAIGSGDLWDYIIKVFRLFNHLQIIRHRHEA